LRHGAQKNVLATMRKSLLCTALWLDPWGRHRLLARFNGDGALIGNLDKFMLQGIGMNSVAPSTKIPRMLFHGLPDDVCDHHGALVRDRWLTACAFRRSCGRGALAARRLCADRALGLGWRLATPDATAMKPGILDFAGGTVVHLNAGIAGLVAAYIAAPPGLWQ